MTKAKQIREFKEANPTYAVQAIADECGVKKSYVYQVLHNAKKKAVKAVKPVIPTQGQDVLRKEIKRLNEDLDGWRELYLSAHEALGQLEQDVVGYRAVISYLQGQLDGVTV
jgi:chemotaxis regulatin CheY-phosphate phosphatase CheZ